MEFQDLEEYFRKLDDISPDLDALAETENEHTAARMSIDLMKLEALDNFIEEHCRQEEVRQAFAMFRDIALRNLKSYINSL